MRILHWTEHFWPLIGGTELLVQRLAQEQQRRGHETLVITDRIEGLAAEETGGGVAVRRLPFTRALQAQDTAAIGRLVAETRRWKETFRPDLVHLHFNGMSAWFHLLSAGRAAAPTVVTLHTPFDDLPASRAMVGRVLDTARVVATVSEALGQELAERWPAAAGKRVVVHNGCPEAARAAGEPPAGAPVLLALGRLSREKGIDVALRAFARVAAEWPAARMVVAGDGPERAVLEKIAGAAGGAARVEFRGWVAPDRVAETIDEATVVLVPSVWREPFGLVAVQAGQRGRPVVASRTGGLPEVVRHGETGWLVTPGDEAELAAAVGRLLREPAAARRLGRAALAWVGGRFSIGACAERYERVYGAALAG